MSSIPTIPTVEVHPLAWRAILDGRPWVCTAAEAQRLANMDRRFRLLTPRRNTP